VHARASVCAPALVLCCCEGRAGGGSCALLHITVASTLKCAAMERMGVLGSERYRTAMPFLSVDSVQLVEAFDAELSFASQAARKLSPRRQAKTRCASTRKDASTKKEISSAFVSHFSYCYGRIYTHTHTSTQTHRWRRAVRPRLRRHRRSAEPTDALLRPSARRPLSSKDSRSLCQTCQNTHKHTHTHTHTHTRCGLVIVWFTLWVLTKYAPASASSRWCPAKMYRSSLYMSCALARCVSAIPTKFVSLCPSRPGP